MVGELVVPDDVDENRRLEDDAVLVAEVEVEKEPFDEDDVVPEVCEDTVLEASDDTELEACEDTVLKACDDTPLGENGPATTGLEERNPAVRSLTGHPLVQGDVLQQPMKGGLCMYRCTSGSRWDILRCFLSVFRLKEPCDITNSIILWQRTDENFQVRPSRNSIPIRGKSADVKWKRRMEHTLGIFHNS